MIEQLIKNVKKIKIIYPICILPNVQSIKIEKRIEKNIEIILIMMITFELQMEIMLAYKYYF